jgi:hypothetical protein
MAHEYDVEEEDHGSVPLELIEWFEAEEGRRNLRDRIRTLDIPLQSPGTFVTRAQWGARAPRSSTRISSTVKGVGLHYEGPTMGSFAHTSCASKVRAIQNFHMDSRGWEDIAYNFLVCPHGYVFEGRGLGKRSAANGTNTGNAYYYAICGLHGVGDPFTDEAKLGFLACIAMCRRAGAGNEVRPHRWFKATACPGDPVNNWINAGLPAPGPVPTPTPTPTPVPDDDFKRRVMAKPTLKLGSTGQDVRILQGLLAAHAEDLAMWFSANNLDNWVDGNFGPNTEYAVREWQKRTQTLTADGVVGPATWAWLVGV